MKSKHSNDGRGSQSRNEERDSNGRFTSEYDQKGQNSSSSDKKNRSEERDSQGRFKSESHRK